MFEKTDVYPFRRGDENPFYTGRPVRKRGGRVLFNPLRLVAGMFSPAILFAGLAGFFLGRAIFLGDLAPFAPAFAAAAATTFGRRGLPVVVMLCIGLATTARGYPLAADMSLVLFSFLFTQAVPPRYSGRRGVMPALVFGLTISVKAAFSAFTGSTPYDYISILFEATLASALTPACLASFQSVGRLDGLRPLNGEETVCLLVLTAGIIAGTGDLQLWYVSVKGFLSRTIILLAALAGGAGLGAAAGAVVGIIPGLSYTVTPYLVGAYSFSGVLAGLGGSLGKPGVALSFLASNIILALYFDNLSGMESVIAETSLACLIFLVIPESLVRKISSSVVREAAQPAADRTRGLMAEAFKDKLREYSSIFRELSRAFGESSVTAEKKDNDEGIRQLLGDISKKVCTGCGMFQVCWEKEYYRTYQSMLDMFTLSEVYDRVKITDIPDEIKLRCTRARELTITATCLYDAFKAGRFWQQKFITGKGIVGEQLKGVSAVIDSLAEEFHFKQYQDSDSDEALKQRLRQLGLPVKEIRLAEAGGKKEISVAMKSCRGDLDCRYRVAPLVSELLGQVFSATGCVCSGSTQEGVCRFRLYQGPQYRVEVAAVGAAREGSPVSGDVYDFLQLREGRFAAVVSDGMGSGEAAARESSAVVAVIRRMLEAGLEMEAAIKTVNSVLALKNPGESFATVDMAVINMYSGQAEFLKIAAPPTFLIRGGRVRSLRANTLPVGVLSDIDINVTEKKLTSQDVIVMITDGVLDAYEGNQDREDWITGVLQELNGLNPREMAELLLKLAQTGSGGEIRTPDDMAVVVIRLEKERVVEMGR